MSKETIAVLGGTGKLGLGLAGRWAMAGYTVSIGSRSLDKASAAAHSLLNETPGLSVRGVLNAQAAAIADIAVLTVPFAHQIATLAEVKEQLQGKILIDTTVPLVPPRVGTVQLPPEGSAAKRAQDFLGENVRVVGAFQNVSADLVRARGPIECDVLVSGNDASARAKVIELIKAAGLRGWHAGPIGNSAAAEAMTSVLIQINRQHRIAHAGIQIVGQVEQ